MINRIRKGDEIWEIFSVSPESPFCFDKKRRIYYKLWMLRNKHSIHQQKYKMINIKEFDKKIIYIFKYDDSLSVPKMSEKFELEYYPVLGKKSCKTCDNSRLGYCIPKNKKITKTLHYKCMYWIEKDQKDGYVFKRKKAKRNDKVDVRISGNIRLRKKDNTQKQYVNE